ncbi:MULTISPECIES: DUF3800 domain-containing protein [unclassified Bradyrhizobium]|uniref:DUF3800 domain-containing protein n=1 Tax=unclassified Bradyrhizobium TaxID=2631580 RepID=UPI0029170DE2|nr:MULTISPECIES: DUF3800 domain-containing protein [unclassified Bradyrhizobium]
MTAGALTIADQSLVVFVDDTGHEALAPGHPVYGLGGCAAMAGDLDRLIRQPWHEVRRKVTGSADTPLHAAAFSRTATPEQIEAAAAFFRTQSFARIGATVSVATRTIGDLSPVNAIAGVLKNRIVDIARWTRCSEVNVIFESSERADRHIEAAFQDFRLEEGRAQIPVECYFMPKAAHDPALEVADFIMHAIGRQTRRRIEGKEGFVPDFAAVFHGQDPKRVSFMDVSEVRRGS